MIELGSLSPWFWLVAPLVVFAAYTVMGITGFGSTIVSVPLLVHFLPITFTVPLMVLLDLCAALLIGRRGRADLSKPELKRLVPLLVVGILLGVTLLVKAPPEPLRLALGIFAVGVGIHGIVNPVLTRMISPWWSVPTGVLGGAMAAVFGAGGPLYATYLSGRLRDKGEIRATVSAMISLSALTRIVVYALTGLLLHQAIFVAMAFLFPFMWLGVRLGGRIHLGLTQENMRRGIGLLLVAIGVSLVVRVLW